MPIVYWMRSFVPMEKKSHSRARRSEIIAALGSSIMMPTGRSFFTGTPAFSSSTRASSRARRAQLGDPGDHGEHDLEVPVDRGAEEGPELGPEHVRLAQAVADRAQPQ